MKLLYSDSDITDDVVIKEARMTDSAGQCLDMLELLFEDAHKWLAWKPQAGDIISFEHQRYTSGKLFLDTMQPTADGFKVLALAAPEAGRKKCWRSYNSASLSDIVGSIASECGMEYALHGVNGYERYPFLVRENETALSFLSRILGYEGAILKCCNGKMNAIGIEWAQSRKEVRTLEVTPDLPGVKYTNTPKSKFRMCHLQSPFGRGTATDRDVDNAFSLPTMGMPVFDDEQASRWARNLLLLENRSACVLKWDQDYDPAHTAMARINTTGVDETSGEWIIQNAEHDFVEMKTKSMLLRCITSIS